MAFQKGKSGNSNGRPRGAKDKRTTQWEIFSAYCLEGGLKKFEEELNSLSGKDYVQAFTNLLEFHKPKLTRSTVTGENGNSIEVKITHVTRTSSK